MARRPRRILIASVCLLAAGAVAVAVVQFRRSDGSRPLVGGAGLAQSVAGLPQQPGDHPPMRLAEGLVPPTNKWFSSLVFSSQPQPVYAYPLTFKPSAAGYEVSYPAVNASPEAYFQTHQPAIPVSFGAASYAVDGYDDLSVGLRHDGRDGQALARTRLTHGSPYSFTTASRQLLVSIEVRERSQRISERAYSLTFAGRMYGVVADAPIGGGDGALRFDLQAGQGFAVFALPSSGDFTLLARFAGEPVVGTASTFRDTGDQLETTLSLRTRGGGDSLFAAMPHQRIIGSQATGLTYRTAYGDLAMYQGKDFRYALADPALPKDLDVSGLSDAQRGELAEQLRTDISDSTLAGVDSYFGGKSLYRLANLAQLADGLGMQAERQAALDKLRPTLGQWLSTGTARSGSNRYFYYDTTIRGVVGVEPSFGSHQFNDHHFHYGYFIYAASVVARYDRAFYDRYHGTVDLLIADIAAEDGGGVLPRLRAFDPYVGHSWASGYGDFADGNNQESVSEAVNAWYAMQLWSQVSDDAALDGLSRWLYAHESEAAMRYWLLDAPAPDGYAHPMVSLVWGGKRDYATFFSPRPQAKLGILLIPMSPGQQYLASAPERIRPILASVLPSEQDYNGQFGDYLAMYRAIDDPTGALQVARGLSEDAIDDANSRSYTLAWVMSQAARHGTPVR